MPSPLSITFPIAFSNHSSWNRRVLPCTVQDRAIGSHVHFEGLSIPPAPWFSQVLLVDLHAKVCTHGDFPHKYNLKNSFELQQKFSAQYKSVSETLSIDFKLWISSWWLLKTQGSLSQQACTISYHLADALNSLSSFSIPCLSHNVLYLHCTT